MHVNGKSETDSKDEFSENINTIEAVLQRYHNNNDLQILDIKCEPGSKTGDNYMSVIKRVKMLIRDENSNSEYSTSVIVKRHISDATRRKLFRCDSAFHNEIFAYCILIPYFKQYSSQLPFPNCLFSGVDNDEREIIILDDLREFDYKMVNRLQGLNFEHCAIVLKELASFHATSLAMKTIDPVSFYEVCSKINEVVYCPSAAEFYSHILESSLNEAISSLSNVSNKNGDLDEPIEILKSLNGSKLYNIMTHHVKDTDDSWKVICHSDLWINNILFHYDTSGKPNLVKFVDLQTVRYTNPVCDIMILLFSSTVKSTRTKHMEQLIRIYQEALISRLHDYLGKKYTNELMVLEEEFSYERIMEEIKQRALYGLATALWILPAVTFVHHLTDIDSLLSSIMDKAAHDEILSQMQSEEYHIRVKDIVEEFYARGYLSFDDTGEFFEDAINISQ